MRYLHFNSPEELKAALRGELPSDAFAGPFSRRRPRLRDVLRRPGQQAQAPEATVEPEAALPTELGAEPGARYDRRLPPPPPLPVPGALIPEYGPPSQVSPNVRVQTRRGYRALVLKLGPGITLLAEVPSSAVHPQFGIDPILTPMLINAAASALTNPQVQQGLVQTAQTVAQGVQNFFQPNPPPVPAPVPWAPNQPVSMVGYQPMNPFGYQPPYAPYPAPVYQLPPVDTAFGLTPYGQPPEANFGCEGCGGTCGGAQGRLKCGPMY